MDFDFSNLAGIYAVVSDVWDSIDVLVYMLIGVQLFYLIVEFLLDKFHPTGEHEKAIASALSQIVLTKDETIKAIEDFKLKKLKKMEKDFLEEEEKNLIIKLKQEGKLTTIKDI